MYKVIEFFTDLHDNNHPYNVGETFPRSGVKVAKERFEELAGDKNKRGIPLIAKVEKPAKKAKKAAE